MNSMLWPKWSSAGTDLVNRSGTRHGAAASRGHFRNLSQSPFGAGNKVNQFSAFIEIESDGRANP